MSQYYFRIHGVNFGPTSLVWLQDEIASGQLSGAEVRAADQTSWTRVDDFVEQVLAHHTPTTQTTPSSPTSELQVADHQTLWYVRMGRAEHGPIEFQKLLEMVAAGRILPIDRVRQSDQTEWRIALDVPGLFCSYPGLMADGSSFASEPTRPSVAETSGSSQRSHTPQTSAIPPAAQAPVQHAMHSPFPPAAQSATYSPAKDTAHSQRSEPQTLNSGADLKVESTRQSTNREHLLSRSNLGPNVGVNQSPPQPKSGPYPKYKGEIKPKPRTDRIGDSQPLFSGNLIMALAGCVLIFFLGRSMIPAEVGQFESPLADLSTAYHALDQERSTNPNGEVRAVVTKDFVDKIDSAKQRITNLSTEHDIRLILLTLSDNLIRAAKSEESDELMTYMEVSRNLLGSATREMQKWKDEAERKRSTK